MFDPKQPQWFLSSYKQKAQENTKKAKMIYTSALRKKLQPKTCSKFNPWLHHLKQAVIGKILLTYNCNPRLGGGQGHALPTVQLINFPYKRNQVQTMLPWLYAQEPSNALTHHLITHLLLLYCFFAATQATNQWHQERDYRNDNADGWWLAEVKTDLHSSGCIGQQNNLHTQMLVFSTPQHETPCVPPWQSAFKKLLQAQGSFYKQRASDHKPLIQLQLNISTWPIPLMRILN